MRRRQILALSVAAVAGCTRGNADAGGPDGTTSTTSTTETTTTESTATQEPCSTDFSVEDPPTKPSSLASSAEYVVTMVERSVASSHFEPDGYFHFTLTEQSSSETGDGVEFQGRVEVDFSSSGDGENSTTVHAHLFYDITYRLTDRRVVRAEAERGPTGTVVCW